LKPRNYTNKYLYVDLGTAKNRKLVHRLVAQAFIPNPFQKPCVNHKDGNRINNKLENLNWVTYSENEKYSYTVLGKKPNNPFKNFLRKL